MTPRVRVVVIVPISWWAKEICPEDDLSFYGGEKGRGRLRLANYSRTCLNTKDKSDYSGGTLTEEGERVTWQPPVEPGRYWLQLVADWGRAGPAVDALTLAVEEDGSVMVPCG